MNNEFNKLLLEVCNTQYDCGEQVHSYRLKEEKILNDKASLARQNLINYVEKLELDIEKMIIERTEEFDYIFVKGK